MSISSDQSAWVASRCVPGSSPPRPLESGVDPGNEVGACPLGKHSQAIRKLLSQVSFHSRVERWIVPCDVSFSRPAGFFPVVFWV